MACCVFECTNSNHSRQLLWLRRKSGGNNFTTQYSLIIHCFSYTTPIIYCSETKISFPFEAGVILFKLLLIEQTVTFPGRRGAVSLVLCSTFTLMDSLASRDDGFAGTYRHTNTRTSTKQTGSWVTMQGWITMTGLFAVTTEGLWQHPLFI